MRISDWSSDVCSSDLHGSARAWTSYQASSLSAIDERLAGTRRLWHEERHEQNARGAAPPDQAGTPPQQPFARCFRAAARCRARGVPQVRVHTERSEEHTSELQSLMRISYAVFCLK